MEKLKSRKLWVTLGAAALQLFGPFFGVPQPAIEAILKLAGFYVGVEGLKDAVSALRRQGQ